MQARSNVFCKVNSAAEAKKVKEKNKKLFLIFLGVAVGFVVLGWFLDIFKTLAVIPVLPAVWFLIVWLAAKNEETRFQNTVCKCGKKFSFPDDVGYTVIAEKVNSSTNEKNHTIKAITMTQVSVHCKCPNCGTETEFKTAFMTQEKTTNLLNVVLSQRDYPIEDELAKYFA